MDELNKYDNQFVTEPKLFSKWSYDDIEIKDPTLSNYMSINETKQRVFLPHTAGRYQIR